MRFFRHFFTFLSIVFVAATGILYYFSPIFIAFPKPTGTYGVGRQTLYNNNLDIVTTLYYPSKRALEQQPYNPAYLEALAEHLGENTWLPTMLWQHVLSNTQCWTKPHAPIAAKRFPLILFSHGIGGYNMYTTYLEELASHGYVVAAVQHTGDLQFSLMPDGRTVLLNNQLYKAIQQNDRTKIYELRAKAHAFWLEDLKLIANSLVKDATWSTHLDTNNIGILGHSHGGGVALDFCKQTPACKAAINMDGWTKTANTTTAFNKPILHLLNQDGMNYVNQLHNNMKKFSTKVVVAGAGHAAFSDEILIKQPLLQLMGIASKNQLEIRKTIANHVVTFFNKTLKTDHLSSR